MTNSSDSGQQPSHRPFSVAVVGGGITGLILTLALVKRDIPVRIFEQAPTFTEIGAGLHFTPNAIRALKQCDPATYDCFNRVATRNGNPEKDSTWFDWVDGYHTQPAGQPKEKWLFNLQRDRAYGEEGDGVHRAHFLAEILKVFPQGVATFDKRIHTIHEDGSTGKMVLTFHDGSTHHADAVIGCDGIRSRVRQIILGEQNKQSYPSYSFKYAYRGLVPIEQAIEALGEEAAMNRYMHSGPDGHVLTFPVAKGKLMNVVAFRTDKRSAWHDPKRMVTPTTKEKAMADYADWAEPVRAIMNLLLDNLDCWGIFDTADNPASTFCKDRICIAGDAAHASSPHHGAGAGFCIEDAAVMAAILDEAASSLRSDENITDSKKYKTLATCFETFDAARRERTQWLVQSSRVAGDVYEWRDPVAGSNPHKMQQELEWRSKKIWNADNDKMVLDARLDLKSRLSTLSA